MNDYAIAASTSQGRTTSRAIFYAKIFILVASSITNFLYWFHRGRALHILDDKQEKLKCPDSRRSVKVDPCANFISSFYQRNHSQFPSRQGCVFNQSPPLHSDAGAQPTFTFVDTEALTASYRPGHLAALRFPPMQSIILQAGHASSNKQSNENTLTSTSSSSSSSSSSSTTPTNLSQTPPDLVNIPPTCQHLSNAYVSKKQSCFALAFISGNQSSYIYNILRFDGEDGAKRQKKHSLYVQWEHQTTADKITGDDAVELNGEIGSINAGRLLSGIMNGRSISQEERSDSSLTDTKEPASLKRNAMGTRMDTKNNAPITSNAADSVIHNLDSRQMAPNGFHQDVADQVGRKSLREKMQPLLKNLFAIEQALLGKLTSSGLYPGDNIVVMVINHGELELLLNFVCSCRVANVTVSNVLVFAGSSEIVPTIESMGLQGFYHPSFAYVSKQASLSYLDSVFVDMMWFKAFSVWLVLKLNFNVLFQDADLVWFRDPFSIMSSPYLEHYFTILKQSKNPLAYGFGARDAVDAMNKRSKSSTFTSSVTSNVDINATMSYLQAKNNLTLTSKGTTRIKLGYPDVIASDDAARTVRNSPYFANSGFYLLLANKRSLYFAWSVMSAFDSLKRTGSHQNLFNTRLQEVVDLAGLSTLILPPNDFPNGYKYGHDRPYMQALRDGIETPMHYHMCWTENKKHKLENFIKSKMWFVGQCEGMDVDPQGGMTGGALTNWGLGDKEARKAMIDTCCTNPRRHPN